MDSCEPCRQVQTYQLERLNEACLAIPTACVIDHEHYRPATILYIDFLDHPVDYGLDFAANRAIFNNSLLDIDQRVVYGLCERCQ